MNKLMRIRFKNSKYIYNLEKLGCGATGTVYRSQNAAIKVSEHLMNDMNGASLFIECLVLLQLNHANIINIIGIGWVDNFFYFTMPLALGPLSRYHNPDVDFQKEQLSQVLKGVDYLHSRNIIHRDLKPDNILVFSNNTLKICDLGMCLANTPRGQECKYEFITTENYRAPEIFNMKNYTHKIDNWAVGCIAWFICTGAHLFTSTVTVSNYMETLQEKIAPLPKIFRYTIKNLVHPKPSMRCKLSYLITKFFDKNYLVMSNNNIEMFKTSKSTSFDKVCTFLQEKNISPRYAPVISCMINDMGISQYNISLHDLKIQVSNTIKLFIQDAQ